MRGQSLLPTIFGGGSFTRLTRQDRAAVRHVAETRLAIEATRRITGYKLDAIARLGIDTMYTMSNVAGYAQLIAGDDPIKTAINMRILEGTVLRGERILDVCGQQLLELE